MDRDTESQSVSLSYINEAVLNQTGNPEMSKNLEQSEGGDKNGNKRER